MKSKIKKFAPKFLISAYHYFMAFAGAVLYGFPSRKMTIIGVTGTKGKSTTVILAGKILEEAGFKVGWISSATIKVGKKEWLNPYHMTMPGRFVLQKLMREMANQKCQYCLVEVTSEGILQHRQKFINFNTAVFTNLKPEHIEAHGSFENYRQAKEKLFQIVKEIHILNLNDENVKYFLQFPASRKYGFVIENQEMKADPESVKNIKVIKAENVQLGKDSSSFMIKDILFKINLLGTFSVYNALAAISIGASCGISLETCRNALEKIKSLPGRMETIIEKPFKVIVDLAHTPDSFEEVFSVLKKLPHNRIISIFGSAGGGRDKWKRPVLGKIAAKYSDFIILTNEDPYDENPNQILSEIKSGIFNSVPHFAESNLFVILDRREAIREGLELAKENDIVLLLGKGAEQSMVIAGKKISWDDRKVVREELAGLNIK